MSDLDLEQQVKCLITSVVANGHSKEDVSSLYEKLVAKCPEESVRAELENKHVAYMEHLRTHLGSNGSGEDAERKAYVSWLLGKTKQNMRKALKICQAHEDVEYKDDRDLWVEELRHCEATTLQVRMRLFHKLLLGSVNVAISANETDRLEKLQKSTLEFLYLFPQLHNQLETPFNQPSFGEILAAIVCVYFDILVALNGKTVPDSLKKIGKKFMQMVKHLLEPKWRDCIIDCLIPDATFTLDDPATTLVAKQLFYPLAKFTLGLPVPGAASKDAVMYTKYVGAVRHMQRLYRQKLDDLAMKVYEVTVPENYLSILERRCGSIVMKHFPTTKTLQGQEITCFLLTEARYGLIDAMLDVMVEDLPDMDQESEDEEEEMQMEEDGDGSKLLRVDDPVKPIIAVTSDSEEEDEEDLEDKLILMLESDSEMEVEQAKESSSEERDDETDKADNEIVKISVASNKTEDDPAVIWTKVGNGETDTVSGRGIKRANVETESDDSEEEEQESRPLAKKARVQEIEEEAETAPTLIADKVMNGEEDKESDDLEDEEDKKNSEEEDSKEEKDDKENIEEEDSKEEKDDKENIEEEDSKEEKNDKENIEEEDSKEEKNDKENIEEEDSKEEKNDKENSEEEENKEEQDEEVEDKDQEEEEEDDILPPTKKARVAMSPIKPADTTNAADNSTLQSPRRAHRDSCSKSEVTTPSMKTSSEKDAAISEVSNNKATAVAVAVEESMLSPRRSTRRISCSSDTVKVTPSPRKMSPRVKPIVIESDTDAESPRKSGRSRKSKIDTPKSLGKVAQENLRELRGEILDVDVDVNLTPTKRGKGTRQKTDTPELELRIEVSDEDSTPTKKEKGTPKQNGTPKENTPKASAKKTPKATLKATPKSSKKTPKKTPGKTPSTSDESASASPKKGRNLRSACSSSKKCLLEDCNH